jgi:hypothetical protein
LVCIKRKVSLKIPFIKETRGLKTTAQTLFDKTLLMPKLSRISDYETTPEKIELGSYCLMILFYQEIIHLFCASRPSA